MQIHIKKLRPGAQAPAYQTAGAAGADVFSCGTIALWPGETAMIPLGFAMEIPAGYAGYLLPRSGLGAKQGIVLGNLVGLIDSDFRHEWHACIWNRNTEGPAFQINHGDRIGQLVIAPVVQAEYIEVDQLSETTRAGGFGSSGK